MFLQDFMIKTRRCGPLKYNITKDIGPGTMSDFLLDFIFIIWGQLLHRLLLVTMKSEQKQKYEEEKRINQTKKGNYQWTQPAAES